jgi:hypothetical protein
MLLSDKRARTKIKDLEVYKFYLLNKYTINNGLNLIEKYCTLVPS